jgi:hypothetical protein
VRKIKDVIESHHAPNPEDDRLIQEQLGYPAEATQDYIQKKTAEGAYKTTSKQQIFLAGDKTQKTQPTLQAPERESSFGEAILRHLVATPMRNLLRDRVSNELLPAWEKEGERIDSPYCDLMIHAVHHYPMFCQTSEGKEVVRRINRAMQRELDADSRKAARVIGEYARECPRFFGEIVKQEVGEEGLRGVEIQYGLEFIQRYPTNILAHMVKDKERLKDKNGKPKPLAVLCFAKEDWNGAFCNDWAALYELSKHYDVRIVEARDEDELTRMLGQMHDKFGDAKVLMLNAHGSPTGMVLSKTEGLELSQVEKREFDITDRDNMRYIKGFLDKRPYVILNSCSTGDPSEYENLAKTFSKELDDVVFAATDPTTGVCIATNVGGDMTDIQFPSGGSLLDFLIAGRMKRDLSIIYKSGAQVSLKPLTGPHPPSPGMSVIERIERQEKEGLKIRTLESAVAGIDTKSGESAVVEQLLAITRGLKQSDEGTRERLFRARPGWEVLVDGTACDSADNANAFIAIAEQLREETGFPIDAEYVETASERSLRNPKGEFYSRAFVRVKTKAGDFLVDPARGVMEKKPGEWVDELGRINDPGGELGKCHVIAQGLDAADAKVARNVGESMADVTGRIRKMADDHWKTMKSRLSNAAYKKFSERMSKMREIHYDEAKHVPIAETLLDSLRGMDLTEKDFNRYLTEGQSFNGYDAVDSVVGRILTDKGIARPDFYTEDYRQDLGENLFKLEVEDERELLTAVGRDMKEILEKREKDARDISKENTLASAVADVDTSAGTRSTSVAQQLLAKTKKLKQADASLFMRREGWEVLTDGTAADSSDRAKAFIAMTDRLGMKTEYLETASERHLRHPDEEFEGRVFVRVWTDKGPCLADPTTGVMEEKPGEWDARHKGSVTFDIDDVIIKDPSERLGRCHIIAKGKDAATFGLLGKTEEKTEVAGRLRKEVDKYLRLQSWKITRTPEECEKELERMSQVMTDEGERRRMAEKMLGKLREHNMGLADFAFYLNPKTPAGMTAEELTQTSERFSNVMDVVNEFLSETRVCPYRAYDDSSEKYERKLFWAEREMLEAVCKEMQKMSEERK